MRKNQQVLIETFKFLRILLFETLYEFGWIARIGTIESIVVVVVFVMNPQQAAPSPSARHQLAPRLFVRYALLLLSG